MAFFLLISLTATVFIRPAEWIAPILAWPIYQATIVCCLVFAWPVLLRELSLENIRNTPITGCILGLLLCMVASSLVNPTRADGYDTTYEFAKTTVFYLLVVGQVDSYTKLGRFLWWLTIVIVATAILALLVHYDIVHAANWGSATTVGGVQAAGELTRYDRLGGPGTNFDPNDFAVFLVVGMVLCLHLLLTSARLILRLAWLAPFGLLAHALWLTQSRGGYVTLLAAICTWSWVKLGWRKTLLCALPLVFFAPLVFSGRMTEIEVTSGTGQARVQLWTTALAILESQPLLGIGPGNIVAYASKATHNSFLNMFAETGFLGGTFFLGTFFCSVLALWRLRPLHGSVENRPERGCANTILAMVVGFVVGNLALSQQYAPTTYLVLGLAAACWRVNGQAIAQTNTFSQFNLSLLARLSAASMAFVVTAHVAVRLLVRW